MENYSGQISSVDPIRSRNMAAIKSKNTRPELKIRKILHKLGYRYRLHVKNLPGCPDLYFPKYNAVIFVHGCFWHHHDCKYFKWPKTNAVFWRKKILANIDKDFINISQLYKLNIRVCIWWECTTRKEEDFVWAVCKFEEWLKNSSLSYLEI